MTEKNKKRICELAGEDYPCDSAVTVDKQPPPKSAPNYPNYTCGKCRQSGSDCDGCKN